METRTLMKVHILYSKKIFEDTVVRTIETIGEKLHSEYYVEQRLVDLTPSVKTTALTLQQEGNQSVCSQLEIAYLEVDRDLMSRVYVSCQSRAMNLDDLSVHEQHPYAQSLSDHGNLRANNKSYLYGVRGRFLCMIHQRWMQLSWMVLR